MAKEEVFVLFFPYSLATYAFSIIVMAFEENGLTVKGLKQMSVRRKFAMQHFSRHGRLPKRCRPSWIDVVTGLPFVAMIFEGEDAVEKARTLTSGGWVVTEAARKAWKHGAMVYSSDTPESVEEDIALWFPGSSNDNNSNDCESDTVFVLPKGLVNGPYKDIRLFDTDTSSPDPITLSDFCFKKDLVFVLIKPVAFQERCVGKLIEMLQRNCLHLKGMKLVDMADFPGIIELSDTSSSPPGIVEDGNHQLGVAMVLDELCVEILILTNNGDNSCSIDDDTYEMKIDSSLIRISTSTEDARELACKFFPNGIVLWPESKCSRLFEASLIGL